MMLLAQRPIYMDTISKVHSWARQTILFGHLSSGRAQVLEEEVNQIADPICQSSKDKTELARQIVVKAQSFLEGTETSPEPLEVDEAGHVMNWVLRTLSIAREATGKSTHCETLEAIAETQIIGGIQGNRSGPPNRSDLDKIIRNTLNYAIAELK